MEMQHDLIILLGQKRPYMDSYLFPNLHVLEMTPLFCSNIQMKLVGNEFFQFYRVFLFKQKYLLTFTT